MLGCIWVAGFKLEERAERDTNVLVDNFCFCVHYYMHAIRVSLFYR